MEAGAWRAGLGWLLGEGWNGGATEAGRLASWPRPLQLCLMQQWAHCQAENHGWLSQLGQFPCLSPGTYFPVQRPLSQAWLCGPVPNR